MIKAVFRSFNCSSFQSDLATPIIGYVKSSSRTSRSNEGKNQFVGKVSGSAEKNDCIRFRIARVNFLEGLPRSPRWEHY